MQKFSQKFEKFIFWLVVLLLVFIPLFPKLPILGVSETFVAVRAEDFLIATTLLVWGLYLITSRQLKSFFTDQLNKVILVFFFIGAISTFSAIFTTQTVLPHLAVLHYLRRIEFLMLLPLVISVVKQKTQVMSCLIISVAVVMLVNLYALGQQYLNFPVISTTNSELSKGQILQLTPSSRINSTFAGHYDLAIFLTMALIWISALFFTIKKKFAQIFLISISLLSFFVLVLTAARLSFVATIAGALSSLLLTGKKLVVFLILILAAATLIYPSQLRDRFISTITVNLWGGGQRYEAKTDAQSQRSTLNIPTLPDMTSTESAKKLTATPTATLAPDIAPGEPVDTTQLGVYRSIAIRVNVEWPKAFRSFEKNPLLGTGYSSLGLATDNDYLRSLGEVGILGTVAFGLILTIITKEIWLLYRHGGKFLKYFSAGTLSVILAFLINALFIDVFEASKIASLFWMIIGINLAAARLVNKEK